MLKISVLKNTKKYCVKKYNKKVLIFKNSVKNITVKKLC